MIHSCGQHLSNYLLIPMVCRRLYRYTARWCRWVRRSVAPAAALVLPAFVPLELLKSSAERGRCPACMSQRIAIPRGCSLGCGFSRSQGLLRLARGAAPTASQMRHFSNKNTPKGKKLSNDYPFYTGKAPKSFVAINHMRKVCLRAVC